MRRLFALLLVVPLLLAGPALAEAAGKNKDKGKPAAAQSKGKGGAEERETEHIVGAIITAAERALIGDYIRTARAGGGLPPGLASREQLPPGLARQIQRNGTLPPGLAKRALPGDLRAQLPRHQGADYRVVGNDIVLIATATGLILDVMKDVLKD